MKILLVATKVPYCDQISEALESLGCKITRVDDRKNRVIPLFPDSPLAWKVVRRINYLKNKNNQLLEKEILFRVETEKPDLFLVIKGMPIKSNLVSKMSSLGIKTANWFLDNFLNSYYSGWLDKHAKSYDFFFDFDSMAAGYLKSSGVNAYYVPVGIDLDLYNSVSDLNKEERFDCQLCFVGAYSTEREEMLSMFKHLDLKIFGWPGWKKSSLAKYYCGSLKPKDFIKLYRQAKICLNMNTQPAVHGVNLKTFEIPASGGFQITDYRKDLDALFEIGKEIEVYKDLDDLRSKVEFYLLDEDKRQDIIRRGKERVFQDHSLKKRMEYILNIINL